MHFTTWKSSLGSRKLKNIKDRKQNKTKQNQITNKAGPLKGLRT